MIPLVGRHLRWLASLWAGLLCTVFFFGLLPSQSALAQTTGNGVNVIIMIGDGMGWEMARAAALAKGTPLYKSGKGKGLSFQNLAGYTYATTYGTTIPAPVVDANGNQVIAFSAGNTALDGSNPLTGASPVRPGFSFKALPFNPGTTPTGGSTDLSLGNLVGYDPQQVGPNPWTPLNPTQSTASGYDKEAIKYSYPDSANTATTLYTGVKSYNNAIGVDIYEQDLTTILQEARNLGKSTGLVTSVPITHATPGAAASTVNRRAKYDADFPALDNILQEAIYQDTDGDKFLPTVLLGGGHPLDHANIVNNPSATGYLPPGTYNYVYVTQANYEYLRANPTLSNRYGYRFLERGPDAASKLAYTAKQINPNRGERLLGLYGARGQDGNIPTSSANGDYSLTGLGNFTLFNSATAATNPTPGIPTPDTDRPLQPGETPAQFIAKERNENPTLKDMTSAALDVLGKDKDGFWLMVEGGDIDWACHDNNLDNLIGTMNDFDKSVQTVIDWIGKNGGWQKNLLIVTADHDHYLTLNDNLPELLKTKGAEALTFTEHNPANAGHFWGSDPAIKYGWGSHSRRMVPVYFQGGTSTLTNYVGRGFKSYGFDVPGVAGAVDQVHIYQAMLNALKAPKRP